MKLLLISNSTNAGEAYLGWPQGFIQDFLLKHGIRKVVFIPYAGVNLSAVSLTKSYDIYEERVSGVFRTLGFELVSVHQASDPKQAIQQAECIVVGGGNTFHLVSMMHETAIMSLIRQKVSEGTPYIGWSAGANVACPTLRTTNDMPIIEPASFDCLNLIPFQINPHYLDANPEGHGGETRQQRIEEFLALNRDITVAGLREASLLEMEDGKLILKGHRSLRVFNFGKEPSEYEVGTDMSFLLK
ncbi:MAG: dipeptidase PepE [Bacteroidales bacterium]|nr:dipeptidase PepE [Bacteroidales bacterium]